MKSYVSIDLTGNAMFRELILIKITYFTTVLCAS